MTIFLAIACGIIAVGFFAVAWRYFSLKRDLRKMTAMLEYIRENDTNARLVTTTHDADISALIHSANETLAQSREGYFELLKTEAAMKRAITNISHDLRTPLTSATGYLQMLDTADEATRARYLRIISGRLDTLAVLMQRLFEYTRAAEGEIHISRVNIADVLRDAIAAMYSQLEAGGFTVEANIPDACFAPCDEHALARILANLLDNAVAHGHSHLRVTLTAGNPPVIEISNSIEEAPDTAHIFDRFYTADAACTGKRTGLGLAIAQNLAGKMGGTITASVEGKTMIMRIHFP
jgi:signal transduction histidine kinase